MANLRDRALRKKRAVLSCSLIMTVLFLIEIGLVYQGGIDAKTKSLGAVVLGLSLIGVFAVHFFSSRTRSALVARLVKNMTSENPGAADIHSFQKLLNKDVANYLKDSYLFLPRSFNRQTEFSRVKSLGSFLAKYKSYSDLKILDQEANLVLKDNKRLSVSLESLVIDVGIFAIPFLASFLATPRNSTLLLGFLIGFRFATVALYSYIALSVKNANDKHYKKLDHFLYGDFSTKLNAESRISLDKLTEEKSEEVLFLVDDLRKTEVEALIRHLALNNEDFKDWSVVSLENSVYKNKVDTSKAFILFPSDMLFPHAETKTFIEAFDEVIIVDASPAFSSAKTAIYYLDQDQRVKRVHIEKNQDRLSGDKGLLIRNFKKKNLDLFLSNVELKVKNKEKFYLVYESAVAGISCSQSFLYPAKNAMVSIKSRLENRDDLYADFSRGNPSLEEAKKFVANCAYQTPRVSKKVTEILRNTYRAS